MKNFLHNLQYLGDLVQTRTGQPITKLYKSGQNFIVFDIVLSTRFQRYYAYEVSFENVQNFLQNKKNTYLLPTATQVVLTVNASGEDIQGIDKVGDTIEISNFTFSDEEWECVDYNNICKLLNIKTNTNELSTSL